jgi:hypothetical protein
VINVGPAMPEGSEPLTLILTRDERAEIGTLLYEQAGRLDREAQGCKGSRKTRLVARAARLREIMAELRS